VSDLDPGHLAWCQATFNLIAPGGVWGVPACGFVFRKTGPMRLTLEAILSEPLDVFAQVEEFEAIREHFGAVGVEVVDGTGAGW
jgi:hypothetical protein